MSQLLNNAHLSRHVHLVPRIHDQLLMQDLYRHPLLCGNMYGLPDGSKGSSADDLA